MKVLNLSIVIILLAFSGCAKEKPVIVLESQPIAESEYTIQFVEAIEDQVSVYVDPPPYSTYPYVVKPGDWLSKIALAEYGDTTKWHPIYAWNRGEIGDNPHFIYPYREFQLRKPADEVPNQYQLFGLHFVQKGESLWSIAAKEYGDPRAWILIFSDNHDMFPNGIGGIAIGTRLKIRKPLK